MTNSADHLEPGPDLARQMAERLKNDIQAGTLEPGHRLPTEAVLGQRFGTSRSVVREALSMLRQSGLVVSRRGSGSYVVDAPTAELRLELPRRSLQSVIKLFELRRPIETEAARLAAERRTPSQLRRIRNALVDIDEAVENGGNGVEEDLTFHRRIAEASDNVYFTASIDFYNRFLQQAITITRTSDAHRTQFTAQVIAEHEAILEAITAGNGQAAADCVADHLCNAERRLREAPQGLLEPVDAPAPDSAGHS